MRFFRTFFLGGRFLAIQEKFKKIARNWRSVNFAKLASWLVGEVSALFLSGVLLRFRLCRCCSAHQQRMFGGAVSCDFLELGSFSREPRWLGWQVLERNIVSIEEKKKFIETAGVPALGCRLIYAPRATMLADWVAGSSMCA
jgi:hypothetical protein